MAEEKILVIQLRQLGDILLTTPVLRAIKRERPKARITFLSHAMGCLVLDDCPFLDEHFFYSEKSTWRDELRLSASLRERHFDLVLDYMNNPRSAFYALRSGATERLAFRSARRPAYTRTVPRPSGAGPEGRYIVDEKFDLLRAAGFKLEASPSLHLPVQPWSEQHTRPLMKLWSEGEIKAAPFVVTIAATHRRQARRWPLERYAEIAARLARDWGAYVLWLWGPGEEAVADEAVRLCREKTWKAPKTSFREMAALIANADLFLGNSNGPSHVAVAASICSLQLHGPTHARSWCPMTEKHRAVTPSAPVPGEITAITVEAVWESLLALRPEVEAQAAAAKAKRPRLTWR